MVAQVLLAIALAFVVLHGVRWWKKDGELSLFYLGVLLALIALNWHLLTRVN